MTIKEQLTSQLKEAMMSDDKSKKQTIRMILSMIKNQEIDEKTTLKDEDVIAVLQKQIKMRQDTLDSAIKAERQDIIDQNKLEMEIIQTFLPKPLTEEELEEIVKTAIKETGAAGIREMGLVMKTVLPQLQGRASSSDASKIVKKLLV